MTTVLGCDLQTSHVSVLETDGMCAGYVDRGMVDESGDQFVAYFLPTEETLDKRRRDVEGEVDYEDGEESVPCSFFCVFLQVLADNC